MKALPISLIGVPTNSSGTMDGVARAPKVLRESGLISAIKRVVLDVSVYFEKI